MAAPLRFTQLQQTTDEHHQHRPGTRSVGGRKLMGDALNGLKLMSQLGSPDALVVPRRLVSGS